MNLLFTKPWLSLLLLPLPWASEWFHFSTPFTFLLSCLALIPLAILMGKATEDISENLGSGAGAVLNATFGNACEFIIALAAVRAGLPDVVRASLTGAILGNTLLVMGAAMFLGGIHRDTQKFSKVAAITGATLLATAAIGLELPGTLMGSLDDKKDDQLSLVVAGILLATYFASLVFAFVTHSKHYSSHDQETKSDSSGWPLKTALSILLVSTIAVVIVAEQLVHALKPTAEALGMTQLFMGVIVVGIVGNAAEHSAAVIMAMKNKMDLAINIALSSATQVALLIAPLLVFSSHLLGKPMDLHFSAIELGSIFAAVIVVPLTLMDGESNWLQGFQLLAVYAIIGSVVYFV
ncbi:MAG: calcium/proton exchanger [Candidatus Obscuribacterales bacterium]|nr:calcium/proton exchanger [Candidatus Obscuribacterales bacterium]